MLASTRHHAGAGHPCRCCPSRDLCRRHVRLVDRLGSHRGCRERRAHLCTRAWLSDRQYLPGSWGRRRRRVILARPGKRRRGNGHGRAFLPVWPRSRFQPEACWGSGNVAAALGETRSFGLPFVLVAATAAASSALLNAHAKRADQRLKPCQSPPSLSPASAAQRRPVLHTMEIASLAAAVVAKAASCGNPILYNRWNMPIFARIPKNLYGE